MEIRTIAPVAVPVHVCICGGPLTQAFPTTTAYDRCRRCGRVASVTQ